MRGHSVFTFGLLTLLLSVAGCKCESRIQTVNPCEGVKGVQPDNLAACSSSTECGDRYACSAVKGTDLQCCTFADRKCNTEADCCPGQTCPQDRKKCFDKYLACESDTDCGDEGDRFCEVYTDNYGTSKRCRLRPCSALGECAEGQSCFQGECVARLPCGGACESGHGCVASIDRCQNYATPQGREEAACPVSCAVGFLATFKDNRNIWDSCQLPAVACVCAELPPIRSNDLGRFSSMAKDTQNNQLWVSTYDGQYGDLVVMRYGQDGQLTHTEYVDGVPVGTPRYGPSGPRGGVVEPGADVGRHTDIAVSADATYVSYYDVNKGDLKWAYRTPDGTWSSFTLDGNTGDLGYYNSVAVDSDGFPAVAYFQKGGSADFNVLNCPTPRPTGDKAYITALKWAKATKKVPTQPSDFQVKTLLCMDRPPPPCTGCTQTCADPGTGPSCFGSATGCTGCDTNTEACVLVNGAPTCAAKYNPANLQELSNGVGLFSSMAFNGKTAFIAYMKREAGKGALYGITVNAQGTAGSPILLDAAGDTGWFPDVKYDSGSLKVLVSYHDFTSKALKFYSNPGFAEGVLAEVIDSGTGTVGSGESNWVGADSSIILGGTGGKVYVVYQDSTRGDLKLAQRTSTWSTLAPVRSEGAVGFFADGAFLNGNLFISHARLKAKQVGGEPRVANALILDKVAAP